MKRVAFCLFASLSLSVSAQRIDLEGTWRLTLPGQQVTSVELPGTLDTNKKGTPLAKTDETTHLSRLFSYQGKAEYEREVVIPQTWRKKALTLFLERTKPSWLYIDGQLMKDRNEPYKINALLAFIARRRREISLIRLIIVGKRSGLDAGKIRELVEKSSLPLQFIEGV